ncbi:MULTISPECIES: ATP synthase subunit B family protein [Microbacterium]|uniref:hypothetical protein n=1 Tax=Microbacterium TaxID=33882 RepID=UPI000F8FB1CA|nr:MULTISPECIES: hypothetical protein [Microbacterium]AZS45653.1 hypothetical protein CVS53_00312 [Microbacterium oxydans]
MSDNYETTSPSGSGVNTPGSSGKVDAAKQEAADLKDTAATQAKDVLGTAKDEAATVVGEAKTQAKDLYAQTQRELSEQAHTQQQRLAGGLRSVSNELGSMATNSEGSGVASDLVQQVSGRLSAAATWLGDRDPGSVLTEVKRYARRKPGTFILAAAIGGIVVGRLTRALAANASDEKDAAPTPAPAPAPRQVHPDPSVPVPVGNDTGTGTPLYSQADASRPDILGEDGYDRPHTV